MPADNGEGLIVPPSAEEENEYDITPPGTEPQLAKWRTVFLVGIDEMGVAHFTPDIEGFVADKQFDHTAQLNEAWLACTQVAKDLSEISIAQRVLMNMQMLGQAMAEQAQADQILRATKLPHQ